MEEGFKYQLDMLKDEIGVINTAIGRLDSIAQKTKEWAVVTWAGSIAIAIGQVSVRQYMLLAILLPALFWYIDAHWRKLQSRFLFRQIKISEFLNSEQFEQAVQNHKFDGFVVLDPSGNSYKHNKDYQSYTSVKRIANFPEIRTFYLGIMLITVILWLVFIFF